MSLYNPEVSILTAANPSFKDFGLVVACPNNSEEPGGGLDDERVKMVPTTSTLS